MTFYLVGGGVGLIIGIGLFRWIQKRHEDRTRAESPPILLDGWDLPQK